MFIDRDQLVGNLIDRSLSPRPDADPGAEYLATQGRLLGERLNKSMIPTFIELGVPTDEVIKLLHKVGTVGSQAYEDLGEPEELVGGVYRDYEVSVDTYIPPNNKDLPMLMESFSRKLEVLLSEATATSIDYVAAWAYVLLIAIHPFPDGNGRTSRSLIEYVRKKFETTHEESLPPLNVDSSEKSKYEMSPNIMGVIRKLGLEPVSQYATTSMEGYKIAYLSGKPDVYFNAVAQLITNHLNDARFSASVLQTDERFEGIIQLLRSPINKAQTKPLVDDYAKAVAQETLIKAGLSSSHHQS